MNSSCTTLFSQGQTTGLVLESGHGLTTVCPVFEGFCQNHSLQSSRFGGQDITQYITEHLKTYDSPYNFAQDSYQTQRIIKQLKESLCQIAENHDQAVRAYDRLSQEQRCFELPDGKILNLDAKIKYTASEIPFNPSIIEAGHKSI